MDSNSQPQYHPVILPGNEHKPSCNVDFPENMDVHAGLSCYCRPLKVALVYPITVMSPMQFVSPM